MNSTIPFERNIYIPSENALVFINFIKACGLETHPSSEVHYKIADKYFSPYKEDSDVLNMCARGMAKTTMLEYAILMAAVRGEWLGFGPCNTILFLGANMSRNVRQAMLNLNTKVDRSSFLAQYIKVTRQVDDAITFVNIEGKHTYVMGVGMDTNFRGTRSNEGDRPQILIADDVLGNNAAASESVKKMVRDNYFSGAIPALDPTHKTITAGTPIGEGDLLDDLQKSKVHTVLRFPVCEKFPVKEKDFKSCWDGHFTYDKINKIYSLMESTGQLGSFYREYMLEVTDLSSVLVDPDADIKYFDPYSVLKRKNSYNFYIATDFAVSEKSSADFTTIGVFAVSSAEDWLLVDGQCSKQQMSETLDDLFGYVRKWKPISVGLESSGQQAGFISIIERKMIEENNVFTLASQKGDTRKSKSKGIRPLGDKLKRFMTGPLIKAKQGKIWLPKPELCSTNLKGLVTEIIHELKRLTESGGVKALSHDDAIDLFNMMSEMQIYPPASDRDTIMESVFDGSSGTMFSYPAGFDEDINKGSTIF